MVYNLLAFTIFTIYLSRISTARDSRALRRQRHGGGILGNLAAVPAGIWTSRAGVPAQRRRVPGAEGAGRR
jgi:hypothetical protein